MNFEQFATMKPGDVGCWTLPTGNIYLVLLERYSEHKARFGEVFATNARGFLGKEGMIVWSTSQIANEMEIL